MTSQANVSRRTWFCGLTDPAVEKDVPVSALLIRIDVCDFTLETYLWILFDHLNLLILVYMVLISQF